MHHDACRHSHAENVQVGDSGWSMLRQSLLEIAKQYEMAAACQDRGAQAPFTNQASQLRTPQQLAPAPAMAHHGASQMHHMPVPTALPWAHGAQGTSTAPAGPVHLAQPGSGAHASLSVQAAPQMLGLPTMDQMRGLPLAMAAASPAAVNSKAWSGHVWYASPGARQLIPFPFQLCL
jgi:hypothetical protein